ncbi:hypothetical protein [Sphingomonas sp. NPDC079357]|jgi:hypothetical protein|uniref:hypothetical protein n=1 Tax=Sphingomonas sp. NPDC079357 TaxID=3364518 RepID=UPI00384ADD85
MLATAIVRQPPDQWITRKRFVIFTVSVEIAVNLTFFFSAWYAVKILSDPLRLVTMR